MLAVAGLLYRRYRRNVDSGPAIDDTQTL